MKSKKLLRLMIGLVLLLPMIALTGCANKVILHPIETIDIVEMKTGESYTPEKDGYFVSDYYMEEVMRARVNK